MNQADRELMEMTVDLAVERTMKAVRQQAKSDCDDICGVSRLWRAVTCQAKRLRRIEFFLIGGGGVSLIAAAAWKLASRL